MADDTRYAYAVARIRGMETRLLDRQWIERLLSEDAAGALKVLSDSAYQEAVSEVVRPEDAEEGLVRALAETLSVVSGLSPEPELVDLFRVRWDFRNLKALVKAALLKVETDEIGLAAGVGTIDVGVLEKAVQDRDYVQLPPVLAGAARAAADAFRDRGEISAVDRVFDVALWEHQKAVAREKSNTFLEGYFTTEIDLLNIKTFVRIKEAGLDRSDFARAFTPGGSMDPSFFEGHLGEPIDAFARSLEYGRYGALAPVFREWSRDRAHLLELACDNVLLKRVERASTVAYGIEPLVAFILKRQIEIKLVRAAIVAKLDAVPRSEVEARMRAIHV